MGRLRIRTALGRPAGSTMTSGGGRPNRVSSEVFSYLRLVEQTYDWGAR